MKKFSEMNANELSTCLCKISRPAENIFGDGAVRSALDEMKNMIGKETTVEKAFSGFTTVLFPVLMNDAHKHDTYEIMATLNESTVKDEESRNGYEFMRDLFKVFVVDGDIQVIFRPCCEARG